MKVNELKESIKKSKHAMIYAGIFSMFIKMWVIISQNLNFCEIPDILSQVIGK